VAEKLAAELPLYARLPEAERAGEVHRSIERNLRAFAEACHEGRPPNESELTEVRNSAMERSREGVPLESMIAAYHLGARVAWDTIVADTGPGDLAWVTAAHDHMISYLQAVVPEITAGYDEQRRVDLEPRAARS
jgi:hypothetical protein